MRKRFEIRKARLTPIVVAHDEWLWPKELVATELSPRGLFLSGERLLPPNECVRLCLRLGTPGFWQFEAVVVHAYRQRRTSDRGHHGMGLELLDASPRERLDLREVLRAYPPPLPPGCRRTMPPEDGGRRRPGRRGGRRRTDPPAFRTGWGTRQLTVGRNLPMVTTVKG